MRARPTGEGRAGGISAGGNPRPASAGSNAGSIRARAASASVGAGAGRTGAAGVGPTRVRRGEGEGAVVGAESGGLKVEDGVQMGLGIRAADTGEAQY